MRLWIAHLISNSNARNDFRDFIVDAEKSLNQALAVAVRENEMEKARGIAHEIKVYEELKKSVRREVCEQNAQVTYLDNVKQGG